MVGGWWALGVQGVRRGLSPVPEGAGQCSLLEEWVPELSHTIHAGLSRGTGTRPFLQRSSVDLDPELAEMPSDIVRYLEWPGVVPGVAKVNVMLAKGPSPALHYLVGHPRSLDLTLKDRIESRSIKYHDQICALNEHKGTWIENG